jgi:hypothetical protein
MDSAVNGGKARRTWPQAIGDQRPPLWPQLAEILTPLLDQRAIEGG